MNYKTTQGSFDLADYLIWSMMVVDAESMCAAMMLLDEHGENQARHLLKERAVDAYFADRTWEHDATIRVINALEKLMKAFGAGCTVH